MFIHYVSAIHIGLKKTINEILKSIIVNLNLLNNINKILLATLHKNKLNIQTNLNIYFYIQFFTF